MGGTTPIPWLQPFYCHFVYVFGDGADLLPADVMRGQHLWAKARELRL
jgi:hypothetical protein